MEYRIQRKVVFYEDGYIDAESLEELKEKLKTATLDWDVDFEFFPEIESVYAFGRDDNGDEVEEYELPKDIMEEDYVSGMNGCIIFNEDEFERYR